jgi:hypothetical protein
MLTPSGIREDIIEEAKNILLRYELLEAKHIADKLRKKYLPTGLDAADIDAIAAEIFKARVVGWNKAVDAAINGCDSLGFTGRVDLEELRRSVPPGAE